MQSISVFSTWCLKNIYDAFFLYNVIPMRIGWQNILTLKYYNLPIEFKIWFLPVINPVLTSVFFAC